MQNENQNQGFRKIERYPNYEIDTCGNIRSVRNKRNVALLKRSDKRGLVQVSLRVNNNKHKETVMDLMEETFTAKELMGELAYDNYLAENEPEPDEDKYNFNFYYWTDEVGEDEDSYVCYCDVSEKVHRHPKPKLDAFWEKQFGGIGKKD